MELITIDRDDLKFLAQYMAECRNAPTLRDQFAIAAIQGFCADSNVSDITSQAVEAAWLIADKMMALRNKKV